MEDARETAARLAAMGHQAVVAPLLSTHFRDLPPPDLTGVQALLATSANGVRAFARLSPHRDLPVLAVGPQTAEAARVAGFRRIEDADGAVPDLVALTARLLAPGTGTLLYACGTPNRQGLAEKLSARGYLVRSEILYDVRAAGELPPHAAQALAAGALDAALFYSPRSAEIFRACLARQGLESRKLIALCISPATRQALGDLAFREVRVAERPNQSALLALTA